MRILTVYLFFFGLLPCPAEHPPQQDAAPNVKKAEAPTETKAAPAEPAENWAVLEDIETGLLPLRRP